MARKTASGKNVANDIANSVVSQIIGELKDIADGKEVKTQSEVKADVDVKVNPTVSVDKEPIKEINKKVQEAVPKEIKPEIKITPQMILDDREVQHQIMLIQEKIKDIYKKKLKTKDKNFLFYPEDIAETNVKHNAFLDKYEDKINGIKRNSSGQILTRDLSEEIAGLNAQIEASIRRRQPKRLIDSLVSARNDLIMNRLANAIQINVDDTKGISKDESLEKTAQELLSLVEALKAYQNAINKFASSDAEKIKIPLPSFTQEAIDVISNLDIKQVRSRLQQNALPGATSYVNAAVETIKSNQISNPTPVNNNTTQAIEEEISALKKLNEEIKEYEQLLSKLQNNKGLSSFANQYKSLVEEFHNFSDEEEGVARIVERLKELYRLRNNNNFEKNYGNEIVTLMDFLTGAGRSIDNKTINTYFSNPNRFKESRQMLSDFSDLFKGIDLTSWEFDSKNIDTLDEYINRIILTKKELSEFYTAFPSKEEATKGLYSGFEEVGALYDKLIESLQNGSIDAKSAINALNEEIAKGIPFTNQPDTSNVAQPIEETSEAIDEEAKALQQLNELWEQYRKLSKTPGSERRELSNRMNDIVKQFGDSDAIQKWYKKHPQLQWGSKNDMADTQAMIASGQLIFDAQRNMLVKNTEALNTESTALENNTRQQEENNKARKPRFYQDSSGQYTFVAQGKQKRKNTQTTNEPVEEQISGQYTIDDYLSTLRRNYSTQADWVNTLPRLTKEQAELRQQTDLTNASLQRLVNLLGLTYKIRESFLKDIHMTTGNQNERLLLSGTKPVINAEYKDVTESAGKTDKALGEETEKLNELGKASENASKKKEKVAKANKELKDSVKPSVDGIEEETDALDDLANAASRVDISDVGYLRNQVGDALDDNFSYTEAINDFVNKRVVITTNTDQNTGVKYQHATEQYLINYDKLTKALIANDKQRLDLEHQIANANYEEQAPLRQNLDLLNDERNRLEQIYNDIATNDMYAANANHLEVVRQRRELAQSLNENRFDAKNTGTASINKQIQSMVTNINQLKTISKDLFKGDETSVDRFIRQLEIVNNLYNDIITQNTSQAVQNKANGTRNNAFAQIWNQISNTKEFAGLSDDLQRRFTRLFGSIIPNNLQVSETGMREFLAATVDTKHELSNYKPTFIEKLGASIKSGIGRLSTYYLSMMHLTRYVREAVQAVTELDTALTELRVVSNASDYSLRQVSKQAFQLAQNLGSTTAEVVKSITDWRRLGETVENSLTLAEQAARLSVGGLMDVSKATESLVSAMKAYGYEVEEVSNIVDKFIYIGNNYSITSEDLATSLEKSSGALVAAGNSLEQAVALEVAGNTVIQDANAVSNALKAISMRLRGTSGSALEEIGEDTEGLVENASKLYEIVKRLTTTASNPNGVEIINKANNSYKSTYQILLEISKVWNEIGDVQQAELLEKLAGKVRGSAVAAILSQGDILENAYYDAMNEAAGAGEQAIENSLNSIEKKTQQFRNELKNLMTDVLSSDTVKGFIDLGTQAISFLDQIIPKINLLGAALGTIVGGSVGKPVAEAFLGNGQKGILSGFKELSNKKTQYGFETFTDNDLSKIDDYIAKVQKAGYTNNELQKSLKGCNKNAKDFAIAISENTNTLQAYTIKSKLATVATNALKTALSTLVSIGIGVIINAIVSAISDLWHEEEKLIDAAKDANEAYKQKVKNITDYSKEIETLTEKLADENLTESETYDIRNQLYKIQTDLIESYGLEAQALDLLNDKYETTNAKIKEGLKLKAKDFVQDNKAAFEDVSEDINKERSYDITPAADLNAIIKNDDGLKAVLKQYTNYDIFEKGGSKLSVKTSQRNAENIFRDLYNALDEYKDKYPELIEQLQRQISWNKSNIVNDKDLQANIKLYNDYASALAQSTDEYYQANDAIDQYNQAVISGSEENIRAAIDNLDKVKYEVLGKNKYGNLSQEESDLAWKEFSNLFDIDYSRAYKEIIISNLNDADNKEVQEAVAQLLSMNGGNWSKTIEQIRKSNSPIIQSLLVDIFKVPYTQQNVNAFADALVDFATKSGEAAEDKLPKDRYDWLGSLSGISLSSDGKGKTWKEIIDAYKSEMGGLEKLIKDNRSPKVKVSLEDILEITDGSKGNSSVFKAIGMDSFTDYMDRTREYYEKLTDEQKEKFIENIGGAGSAEKYAQLKQNVKDNIAGAQEELDKLIKPLQTQFSLDQFAEDAMTKLFEKFGDTENIEDMDAVKEEIMEIFNITRGGSDVIDDLIASYNELMGVYKKLKSGETLSKNEMTTLISKYGALEDAVIITSDGYKIEEDALKNLINQYIAESNTAVAAEVTLTQVVIEGTKNRIKNIYKEAGAVTTLTGAYFYGISTIESLIKAYENMREGGYQYDFYGRVKEEYGEDIAADIKQIIDLYEYIDKLQEQFNNENLEGNDLKKDTKIDWIANSVKNIESAANSAKSALDRLFTTAGSSKAVEKANELLEKHTAKLENEKAAYEKAAESYQAEFNKLGFSNGEIELIKNAVTTGQTGWDIRKYSSKDAETLNSGIDLWSKILEYTEKALDVKHQIDENNIQDNQNWADYYANEIARVEAQITPETSLKKQQAYTRELVNLYTKQYNEEIAIANAKDETIKAAELEAQKQQKINELLAQEIELSVDATTTRYDRILSEFDNRQRVLEHGIAMTEANGALVSSNYYKALIDNEKATMQAGLEEREKLIKDLNDLELKGINSKEDLELWWKTKNAIDECTSSLYDSEEAVLEWKKAIRSNEWTVFDRIQDTISRVGSEADYLINAMSNKDLFAYTKELWSNDGSQTKVFYGDMTEQGLATLGLHQLKVAEFKEQVEDYRKEIQQLYKDIADNPTDLELIDRKNELIDKERELALAIRQEQDAIIDLIRDGYQKQLDSLSELTSKYMEALNAEKD